MAPKSKGKAAASATPPEETDDAMTASVNQEYLTKFAGAFTSILEHKVFKHAESKSPLDISEGRYTAPFSEQHCSKRLGGSQRQYEAGSNLFWLNVHYGPDPGVPIVEATIRKLQTHYFENPPRFPFSLIVGVTDPEVKIKRHQGALKCVSPCEVVHAFIWAIVDDIAAGKPNARLEEWLRVARTTTIVYELIASEVDVYWRAFNLRENISEDYTTMARTCLQTIYTIVNFKALQERISGGTLSAAKVAEFYQEKAHLSSPSEKLARDYIDKALTVYNSFLTTLETLELLTWHETNFGVTGPFSTISALHCLTSRAKNKKDRVWLISYILDFVRMGFVERNELSFRIWGGTKQNPRGYADLIMWKIVERLLAEGLPSRSQVPGLFL